jgi:ubiquinone/menaquinone biosynthesis C-methylase UbiE
MAEIKILFDAAEDYERFMGRWSRAVGEQFLPWLAAPAGGSWLDVGCGTGAFSQQILASGISKSLTGVDPSPQQIDYVRRLLPACRFEVAAAEVMPFDANAFDVVVSALVIHFIPDRAIAFAEMKRVLRKGGLVGGYTWKRTSSADFAAYVPVLNAAEKVGGLALRSATVPEGTVEGMVASLQSAGFIDAEVTEIQVTQTYANFEEYWSAQTLPFSPSGKTIAKLDDAQRQAAQKILREMLVAADGSIRYSTTAIAGKAYNR